MSGKNSLRRYLNDQRVKHVLSKKPFQDGFSLIELVVVIAVLAILSAVAIPNFLSVQKDGKVAAAKNTLATIVKECVTSDLRGTGTSFVSAQAAVGKLNGYTLKQHTTVGDSCFGATASSDSGDKQYSYSISYNTADGSTIKTCTGTNTDYVAGCFTNSTLAAVQTAGVAGSW